VHQYFVMRSKTKYLVRDTFQLSGETELLGSSTANGTTQSDYALYASNDHSAGPAATLHVLVGG
jgi:hypothetical protein